MNPENVTFQDPTALRAAIDRLIKCAGMKELAFIYSFLAHLETK